MKVPVYHVDAFASRPFERNPAAICPLESWLPDATLQAIAGEHNLSETAYYVARGGHYEPRWFTPEVEGRPLRPRDGGFGPRDLGPAPRSGGKAGKLSIQERRTRSGQDLGERTRPLCAGLPLAASAAVRGLSRFGAGVGSRASASTQGARLLVRFRKRRRSAGAEARHGSAGSARLLCGDRDGSGKGLRFRVAFFCAGEGSGRGSGDGIGPLHADSLL